MFPSVIRSWNLHSTYNEDDELFRICKGASLTKFTSLLQRNKTMEYMFIFTTTVSDYTHFPPYFDKFGTVIETNLVYWNGHRGNYHEDESELDSDEEYVSSVSINLQPQHDLQQSIYIVLHNFYVVGGPEVLLPKESEAVPRRAHSYNVRRFTVYLAACYASSLKLGERSKV